MFYIIYLFVVYVNLGADTGDTATVTMTWGSIASAKQYNIFVQQIECSSPQRYAYLKIYNKTHLLNPLFNDLRKHVISFSRFIFNFWHIS